MRQGRSRPTLPRPTESARESRPRRSPSCLLLALALGVAQGWALAPALHCARARRRCAMEERAVDDSPLPQRAARGKRARGPVATPALAASALPDDSPAPAVNIDGSMLEGGGQIIRVTSALSALLGTPIHIDKIRAGRSKGGLGAQHVAGLKLVGQLSGAALEGVTVGSPTAAMTPCLLARGGRFMADAGTAGATMLMLQSALPCCCFRSPGDERESASTQIVLKGGTNVPFAPQYEYMEQVTLATMRRIYGLDVGMSMRRRGCFPRGGGEVEVTIHPLTGPLPAFEMLDRGTVAHVSGRVWASGRVAHEALRKEIAICCEKALRQVPELAAVPVTIDEGSGVQGWGGESDGCGVVLWAVTSTGSILGGSALLDKTAKGKDAARQVASKAVDELARECNHHAHLPRYSSRALPPFPSSLSSIMVDELSREFVVLPACPARVLPAIHFRPQVSRKAASRGEKTAAFSTGEKRREARRRPPSREERREERREDGRLLQKRGEKRGEKTAACSPPSRLARPPSRKGGRERRTVGGARGARA